MEEDHRCALALVEVRKAQPVDLAIAGLEGKVGKSLQHLIGGAHRVGHIAAEHTPRLIG